MTQQNFTVDYGLTVRDGNLDLIGSSNIVSITTDNSGSLGWVGNSSGDGNGFTTLELRPDDTLTAGDQYLIIDPTAPTHIHIRAGGTQDSSSAQLYLGGENSHFSVGAGANPPLYLKANNYQWTFGTDGNIYLPSNTFAVNYANGAAVSLSGNYGDSNVSSLLGTFGSNTISTTGNVTVGNIAMSANAGRINFNTAAYITGDVVGREGSIRLEPYTGAGSTFPGVMIGGAGRILAPNQSVHLILNATDLTVQVATKITSGTVSTSTTSGALQVSGGAGFTGNVYVGGNISGSTLFSSNASGDEGGEIQLAKPPNGTLSGGVSIDAYVNRLRVFEQGGTARGMYFDIANAPAGVGSAVGYREVPQVIFSGDTTLIASDAGKHYYSTLSTTQTLTIANNAAVSWEIGTAITIVNRGTGNITVAQGSGVSLYLAGNSTASNRTITTYGMATLLNVAANVWMINGTGVS